MLPGLAGAHQLISSSASSQQQPPAKLRTSSCAHHRCLPSVPSQRYLRLRHGTIFILVGCKMWAHS